MYKLPKIFDLRFFHELLIFIKNNDIRELILDWQDCIAIEKNTFCAILHLKEQVNLKHINQNQVYEDSFLPILNYDLNNPSLGIFISPILSEERLLQHKELMKDFYKNSTDINYDYSILENIFAELYMNVCQHSELNKGFIFIDKPNVDNCLMLFSDLGVGIAEKIKKHFKKEHFISDAAAICYATQEGVTTQSQIQNQGKGLNNLVSQVQKLEAKLAIYANRGILGINKTLEEKELDFIHQGSLIVLEFNLTKLSLKEDSDDYSGEI